MKILRIDLVIITLQLIEQMFSNKAAKVYNPVTFVTGHPQTLWPLLIQIFQFTDQ